MECRSRPFHTLELHEAISIDSAECRDLSRSPAVMFLNAVLHDLVLFVLTKGVDILGQMDDP